MVSRVPRNYSEKLKVFVDLHKETVKIPVRDEVCWNKIAIALFAEKLAAIATSGLNQILFKVCF